MGKPHTNSHDHSLFCDCLGHPLSPPSLRLPQAPGHHPFLASKPPIAFKQMLLGDKIMTNLGLMMYVLSVLNLGPVLLVTLVAFQYFQTSAFCFVWCFHSALIVVFSRRVGQIQVTLSLQKSLVCIFILTFHQNHFQVLAREFEEAKIK